MADYILKFFIMNKGESVCNRTHTTMQRFKSLLTITYDGPEVFIFKEKACKQVTHTKGIVGIVTVSIL